MVHIIFESCAGLFVIFLNLDHILTVFLTIIYYTYLRQSTPILKTKYVYFKKEIGI